MIVGNSFPCSASWDSTRLSGGNDSYGALGSSWERGQRHARIFVLITTPFHPTHTRIHANDWRVAKRGRIPFYEDFQFHLRNSTYSRV